MVSSKEEALDEDLKAFMIHSSLKLMSSLNAQYYNLSQFGLAPILIERNIC